MASVNRVTILGNLGRDPEVKYATSGDAICNFSIATTEKWKDKATGDQKEKTEWHRLVAFGRLAEVIGEYVKKGDPLYVEGKLQTREYEKEGQKHYSTEIVVQNMQLLGSRRDREEGESSPAKPAAKPASTKKTAADGFDDDIPF